MALLLAISCNKQDLPTGSTPIGFTSNLSDDLQDATKASASLNQDFVVFGRKLKSSETTVVFPWYKVRYVGGTEKYTYSGLTSPSGLSQSIKYWDHSAESYTFSAYSPTTATKVDDNHVSFAGIDTTTACIARPSDNVVAHEDFGQTVTLKFIPLKTKIRVGFYETIAGCSIKNVSYTLAGKYPTSGDYTVKLDDASISEASYTDVTDKIYGATPTGTLIGTASNASTMSAWIPVLPLKVDNAVPLSISIEYTLVDNLSGRTKNVSKSAEVPQGYAQWAFNKAYTYIFKISEAGAEFDSFFKLDITQVNWDDRSDQNEITELE